jgi:hypothetical protein
MKLKTLCAAAAIAAMLSAPAMAGESFSALQGVDAQALSVDEMKAITGERNAYDIASVLFAEAAQLDAHPLLQAATLRRAQYYLTNAVQLNAAYAKLGILTPCLSCK